MTRTQSNTLLGLDACLVAIENKLLQIENIVKRGSAEYDVVQSALKESKKAENLIIKLADILK